MTTLSLEKLGLVAHYSDKGRWAFDLALHLAITHRLHLNVFHFAMSPYEVSLDVAPEQIPAEEIPEKKLVELDRELREYYDELLGEYDDVGFRVCENPRHNLTLRQCLREKEYQLLIIPYLQKGAHFGNMSIEEFAYRFGAPTILVGPDRPDQYYTNPPADLFFDSIDFTLYRSTNICLTPHPISISMPQSLQQLSVL